MTVQISTVESVTVTVEPVMVAWQLLELEDADVAYEMVAAQLSTVHWPFPLVGARAGQFRDNGPTTVIETVTVLLLLSLIVIVPEPAASPVTVTVALLIPVTGSVEGVPIETENGVGLVILESVTVYALAYCVQIVKAPAAWAPMPIVSDVAVALSDRTGAVLHALVKSTPCGFVAWPPEAEFGCAIGMAGSDEPPPSPLHAASSATETINPAKG